MSAVDPQGNQNERAVVPAGNPAGYGMIGNNGIQSMPAQYQLIQRRNAEPPNQGMQTALVNQQSRIVHGNVARCELSSTGSNYQYAAQEYPASYMPSDVRTITDEEIEDGIARGEIDVLYEGAEGDDGSSDAMRHCYDRD